MSDPDSAPSSSPPKPWTIKGVSEAARTAALAAAKADGRHMGTWIEAAILHRLETQARPSVFPPPGKHPSGASLAELAERCAEAAGVFGSASADAGAPSPDTARKNLAPRAAVVVFFG
jgi:hypothetical protein